MTTRSALATVPNTSAAAVPNSRRPNITVPERSETGISFERYGAAGLLGTFVGFGSGHAVAKQWKKIGWVYTLTESIAAVTMATSFALVMDDFFCDNGGDSGWFGSGDPCKHPHAGTALTVSFGALLVLRAVETADIWLRPTVIQHSNKTAPPPKPAHFTLAPSLSPTGLGLAASIRF